jgi:hypothetical protein
MPKRIDHVVKDGQELKWCPRCQDYRPLTEFHSTNGRTWDGLFWLCKDHANEKRKKSRSYNAAHVWKNMQLRVMQDPRYTVKGIQVRMTQAAFTSWYKDNWFEGCLVDRIDNDGHYEIGNLQLLNRVKHNQKAREDKLKRLGIIEPDGQRFCYQCGELKKHDEFYRRKDKVSGKNPLGLIETCKSCRCKEGKQRYLK